MWIASSCVWEEPKAHPARPPLRGAARSKGDELRAEETKGKRRVGQAKERESRARRGAHKAKEVTESCSATTFPILAYMSIYTSQLLMPRVRQLIIFRESTCGREGFGESREKSRDRSLVPVLRLVPSGLGPRDFAGDSPETAVATSRSILTSPGVKQASGVSRWRRPGIRSNS
jgi:hypothetical protein